MNITYELRAITPSTDFSDLPIKADFLPALPDSEQGECLVAVTTDDKVIKACVGDFLVVPMLVSGTERKRKKPAPVGFFAISREDVDWFKGLSHELKESEQTKAITAQLTYSEFMRQFCNLAKEYAARDAIHDIDRAERPELCAVADAEKYSDGYKPISDYLKKRKLIRDSIEIERKKLSELDLPPGQKALLSALLNWKAEALLSEPDETVRAWAESAPEALKGTLVSKAASTIKAKKEAKAKAEAVRAEKQKAAEAAKVAEIRAEREQKAANAAAIRAANSKREAQRAAQEAAK